MTGLTAMTIVPSSILRVVKQEMLRVLHEKRTFSNLFVAHVLSRYLHTREDLIDQLFNSSERRLARINQETLAGRLARPYSRATKPDRRLLLHLAQKMARQ